jgi:S-DNA-T family DNA segregation ATPase FtsK/SpoIIIE
LAATARSRKRSSATAPTLVREDRVRFGTRLLGALRSLPDRIPQFELVDRFQRELLGVFLVFMAGLTGWALARGDEDGRLLVFWRDVVVAAYGVVGGWLVPVFLVMVAWRVLRDTGEPILRPHHVIGGFCLAVAVLGLLELGVGRGGFHPAGNFGLGVATVAMDTLGEIAAGITLYLLGTVAVLLLAQMSPSRFYAEVRSLIPERRPRVVADDDFDHWPDDGDDEDARIGMDGRMPGLPSRTDVASGRFRRSGVTVDQGPNALDGPVRAVGDVDHELEVLTPPRPSRRRQSEAAQRTPVAPVRVTGSTPVAGRGDTGASTGAVPAWSIPITVPERPSPEPRSSAGRSTSTRPSAPFATVAPSPPATSGTLAAPAVVTRTRPAARTAVPMPEVEPNESILAPEIADEFDDDTPFADEPIEAAASRANEPEPRMQPEPEPAPVAPAARTSSRRATTTAAAEPSMPTPEPTIRVPVRQGPQAAPAQLPVSPIPAPSRALRGEPMPLPPIEQLPYYETHKPNEEDLAAKARLIQEKLASFRVQAWVREINTGPAVTQFALEPGEGVKVRRITELQNDLALALAAPSLRIEAPVPGFARVGIEVPNAQIMTVGLRETLESSAFRKGKQKLPIPLGLDVNGKYIVGDLTKMPHLLIAGATGAGKSVCINGIISTFLLTRRPDEVKLLMIDPKMVELSGYNGVPHLQAPVVTEMPKVVPTLRLVLREMERRYAMFSQLGVRNLDGYRLKTADEPGAERLPYLVVIIDELADLMMTTPVEVESLLQRLTQMARATGIHLIIATQRPSVDVLTGIIKANVPARIAFMVSSGTDSRVILDVPGAERLLGKGDMLFLPPDAAKPQRIQGAFVADEDVPRLVEHWQRVVPVPEYAEEWINLPTASEDSGAGGSGDLDEEDPLWDQAIEIVRKQGTASASMLQRRLRIGYNRAARMIQEMEDQGIIGPADGIRGRTVFLTDESAE